MTRKLLSGPIFVSIFVQMNALDMPAPRLSISRYSQKGTSKTDPHACLLTSPMSFGFTGQLYNLLDSHSQNQELVFFYRSHQAAPVSLCISKVSTAWPLTSHDPRQFYFNFLSSFSRTGDQFRQLSAFFSHPIFLRRVHSSPVVSLVVRFASDGAV